MTLTILVHPLRIKVLGQVKNKVLLTACLLLPLVFASSMSWGMSLSQAILQAQQQDPWLDGSQQKEYALRAQGLASDSLPNPELSFGLLNVPSDGFALDQEPMTQFKVGVKQSFTRGQSRRISRQRYQQLAAVQPFLRDDRLKQVALTVTLMWLDLYQANQEIALALQLRETLQQLIDISKANYATTFASRRNRATQNDVLMAQLTLAKVDDRIVEINSSKRSTQAKLCQWLAREDGYDDDKPTIAHDEVPPSLQLQACHLDEAAHQHLPLFSAVPSFVVHEPLNAQTTLNTLQAVVSQHPRAKAAQQSISASEGDVKLAAAQYAPLWGVNLGYAYRQDDAFNQRRADFWSVSVSMDMPLFSRAKQDNALAAAHHQKEAMRTEYRLVMREMVGQLNDLAVQYRQYQKRVAHYEGVILPNIAEQKEVSVANLSHDYGSLELASEVLITANQAEFERLALVVKQQKVRAKINYFLPGQSLLSSHDQENRP
ncbi:outer membrane efflux protein [Paraglaciecola sp. T6c]|uniref:TolC family protein n=1 Tax=Pseudoalteromonas atlantica (strain T6c / ATCC BAA-1087) TaxID=3042615 RepID=UPI00005C54EC|nr:TolC family protein [Paraglaciecola sp. T6c]ABG40910.1 outer membrane efflux protein [Paraglaciecola sp. T6c]